MIEREFFKYKSLEKKCLQGILGNTARFELAEARALRFKSKRNVFVLHV